MTLHSTKASTRVENEARLLRVHPDQLIQIAVTDYLDHIRAKKLTKINRLIASKQTRFTESDREWMVAKIPLEALDQIWCKILRDDDAPPPPPDILAEWRKRKGK